MCEHSVYMCVCVCIWHSFMCACELMNVTCGHACNLQTSMQSVWSSVCICVCMYGCVCMCVTVLVYVGLSPVSLGPE